MTNKPKVVVVATDATVRAELQRVLSGEEWNLRVVGTAAEGLAQLAEPVPHLVLAVEGDELDALRFFEAVRTVQPATLRIIVVGQDDLESVLTAVCSGLVYRFVLKPWDAFDLRVMLRLAVRKASQDRRETQP